MIADDILQLTGPAVLLDIKSKSKAPKRKAWQQLTLEDMSPSYKADLQNNIGVSLGAPSQGLHTIDCDDDEAFKTLLKLNPELKETLQSHGARGGNFWVRIDGEAPKNSKIKSERGEPLGEWRGTGNQTVIHGMHPKGSVYRNNGKRALSMCFEAIKWPDNWSLPWEDQKRPIGNPPSGTQEGPIAFDRVQALLDSIPKRPSYDLWLKISASVRNAIGDTEKAIELLKTWSPEEVQGEYEKLLQASFPEISYKTLIYHAERHGFSGVVKKFFYTGYSFQMQSPQGFIPLRTESQVCQHLTEMLVPKQNHPQVLCSIRENQFVSYVGPVAGHSPGLYRCNGEKILATRGPIIIEAKNGEDYFIGQFFRSLLGDTEHPEQIDYFLDTLAYMRRAVITGQRVQSPVIALIGKRGDGKSLAIEIMKQALGGRTAKAYRFMSGDTCFNADLVGAELLVIDDDAVSKDHRSRVTLAHNIKTNLFSGSFRLEAKGRDAIECYPTHAMVMALNDDPEHLRVLPEIDESMMDKINLFKTSPSDIPKEVTRQELARLISESIPAFVYQLDQRDISQALDSRRRIKCFMHPEIYSALNDLSPEIQLLGLIHQNVLISGEITRGGKWVGTASELQSLLTDYQCSTAASARHLLSWSNACGTYLGRLAQSERFGVKKTGYSPHKIQRYTISLVGG